tara:strand:- start:198 stop:470 length:273 start_codon:yes stop_codon:yes gene_type:complete
MNLNRFYWSVVDSALQFVGEQLFAMASMSRCFRAFADAHTMIRKYFTTAVDPDEELEVLDAEMQRENALDAAVACRYSGDELSFPKLEGE